MHSHAVNNTQLNGCELCSVQLAVTRNVPNKVTHAHHKAVGKSLCFCTGLSHIHLRGVTHHCVSLFLPIRFV